MGLRYGYLMGTSTGTGIGHPHHTRTRTHTHVYCYRPSKRPNCSRGTCSGLGTWRPRCTKDTLSGMRHVVPFPFPSLIAHVTAPLSGAASPMGPVSYMTRASVRVPVPFPQLSLHVRKLSSNHSQSLRFGSAGDRSRIASYCLVSPRVCLS